MSAGQTHLMREVLMDDDPRTILADEIDLLRGIVTRISDAELVLPSGCRGWLIAHLLVHLRLDGEAVLESLALRTDRAVDRDWVSYWADWPAGAEANFAAVRFHWASAASYSNGDTLRRHFDDTHMAAAAAAKSATGGSVPFQDHVLTVDDLLIMWVVEYAIHHLDLASALPGAPGPDERALELAAQTLDRLIDAPRPGPWETPAYVRKGTGRMSLDEADLLLLGDLAARYPAFG
jgi:hypothetical protein